MITGGNRALTRDREPSALPVILIKEVLETTHTLLFPTPPPRLESSDSTGRRREYEATLLMNSWTPLLLKLQREKTGPSLIQFNEFQQYSWNWTEMFSVSVGLYPSQYCICATLAVECDIKRGLSRKNNKMEWFVYVYSISEVIILLWFFYRKGYKKKSCQKELSE